MSVEIAAIPLKNLRNKSEIKILGYISWQKLQNCLFWFLFGNILMAKRIDLLCKKNIKNIYWSCHTMQQGHYISVLVLLSLSEDDIIKLDLNSVHDWCTST